MSAGSLQELVATAAIIYSHRVAVTFDNGSPSDVPVNLLYKDLLELAVDLSLSLRTNCTPATGLIGIYCSDDLFVPVWILGILQTPAAYVPLDPDAPGLFTARVMVKSDVKHCAVKTDLLQQFEAALVSYMTVEVCTVLPKFKLTLVRVKPHSAVEDQQGTEQTRAQGKDCSASPPIDLAYVLHTSGTTGSPKIVKVPHKCILPNIIHLRSLFEMSTEDLVFLASPLTFDPSVVDIFLALSSGAQLLIIPSVFKKMPNRLSRLLFTKHRTTVLQVTPTLLSRFSLGVLKQEVLSFDSSLRVLALGGESCPSPSLLSSWRHEGNKTHIFNIYGITEVSCWACCYKFPQSLLQSSSNTPSSVPLGAPLMGTLVEVRDEKDCIVTEGEGQVFIGGEDRVCLLDSEHALLPGTMRATGDWVTIKNSQLFYLGRKDREIKRHGKRINLDSLQQLILSLPEVQACAVCLHKDLRLLAFVVASTSEGQAATLPPEEPRLEEIHSASADHQQEPSWEPGGSDTRLKKHILKQLSLLVPSHCFPDMLVLVPTLSLNSHGKVDMRALTKTFQSQRRWSDYDTSSGDITILKKRLQTLWQDALGLPDNGTVDEESRFLFSGGDSLKAIRLCEDIRATASVTSPQLLEIILDGSFSDVLRHIATVTPAAPGNKALTKKRQAEALSIADAKRAHTEDIVAERLHSDTEAVTVVRRAGEIIKMKLRNGELIKSSQAETPREKNPSKSSSGVDFESRALSLNLSWSSDTGRCVDASPVVLVHEGPGVSQAKVFIGSHSHRIQALDLNTGVLVWERVLGGRIEASAAVSHFGKLVVVGCYDGFVYFLCAATGETKWVFETDDAVKSCAAVDPHTGLVIVGSHDGHVYALNSQVQQCVWKHHCESGAVFSSPCLHTTSRQLYVATLGGQLLCLHPDSGKELWSHCRDSPFFSSPSCTSDHVFIGSVDGNICCFSNTGKLCWQFLTEGPVFSSACVTPDLQMLVCGSHDGRLYCLSCADGSLLWTFKTGGKVYSCPFVFDGSSVGWRGTLVVLTSTDGTVHVLDAQCGQLLVSCSLPGELFSSPVVFESSIVVGCRNDYVYCLKLTIKEET